MGGIKMSVEEQRRLEVMTKIRDKEASLVQALEWLAVSYRQTKRVWRWYC
jgi:hypothetical protein